MVYRVWISLALLVVLQTNHRSCLATEPPSKSATSDTRTRGSGFFAVEDDLKLGPAKKKPAKIATETPTPKAATVQPVKPDTAAKRDATSQADSTVPARPKSAQRKPTLIDLKLKKSDDPIAAWHSYFARHPDVPAEDVRETARQLRSGRRFDQVSALIQGALAHGQVQPWMYEALALSMQATGSPAADVERALMSAVDFGENVDDLMYVAQYMARSGLDQRAIKVFRTAGTLDPTRPEPFVHALQLSQRLNDLEGTQWASLGILRQAWPREKSETEKSAFLAARAVYARLVDEKRTQEAADFKTQLDKALIRDIKVVVSWTGAADIDVYVEEPSGTICSLRNRRTTSGGMLLGEIRSPDAPVAPGASSETYVCPQAFSGTYKILLRRVWGKVTAGKVTVDVYTHFGTKQVRRFHNQIPLGEQDTIATVDLADGRRQESLGEQQVANAAVAQVALNQAILNQQLNAATSTAGNASLLTSRGGLFGAVPLIQQAVGYQPVIITLPAGANFTATGVISADRRYVRITALPLFSQIGMVTTFNVSSGAIGSSPTPPPGGGGVSGGTNGFPPPSTTGTGT